MLKCEELYEYDTAISAKGIFIAGGYKYSKERPHKLCYEYHANNKTINEKPGLLLPRAGVALIGVNRAKFYCVGGYYKDKSTNIVLNNVEKFDYALNKWEDLPPISQLKCFASLCIHNKDIYCIGGKYWNDFVHDFDYVVRIEKMNTEYEYNGWEVLKFESSLGNEGRMRYGCISTSKSQILVFGGETKARHEECYYVDTKGYSIQNIGRTAEVDAFGQWKPILSCKHMFVFSIYFNLHICNVGKQKWRVIPKEAMKWIDIP